MVVVMIVIVAPSGRAGRGSVDDSVGERYFWPDAGLMMTLVHGLQQVEQREDEDPDEIDEVPE